jgi:hypothetical protein
MLLWRVRLTTPSSDVAVAGSIPCGASHTAGGSRDELSWCWVRASNP